MSDGQHKVDEDRQDYLDLCERMGVRPRYTASNQPDCYGVHASELRERLRREGAPCYAVADTPLPLGKPAPGLSLNASAFKDYLQGHVSKKPYDMVVLSLLGQQQWSALAKTELERRVGLFLEKLPTEVLADIVQGQIDPVEHLRQVREGSDERR